MPVTINSQKAFLVIVISIICSVTAQTACFTYFLPISHNCCIQNRRLMRVPSSLSLSFCRSFRATSTPTARSSRRCNQLYSPRKFASTRTASTIGRFVCAPKSSDASGKVSSEFRLTSRIILSASSVVSPCKSGELAWKVRATSYKMKRRKERKVKP